MTQTLTFGLNDFMLPGPGFMESLDFIQMFGDREAGFQNISFGNELIQLNLDYRFFGHVGFEIDLELDGGSIDVFSNLELDLSVPGSVETGEIITIDTSSWGWGNRGLIATGTTFELDVDFVADIFFANLRPEIQLLPNNEGESLIDIPIDGLIPNVFGLDPDGGRDGFRADLFTLDNSETLSQSFSLPGIDIIASIPEVFPAFSASDDFGADGVVLARGVSDPILQADFNLIDFLGALAPPIVAPLSNSIELSTGCLLYTSPSPRD